MSLIREIEETRKDAFERAYFSFKYDMLERIRREPKAVRVLVDIRHKDEWAAEEIVRRLKREGLENPRLNNGNQIIIKLPRLPPIDDESEKSECEVKGEDPVNIEENKE